MIDIGVYQAMGALKRANASPEQMFDALERARSQDPVVFNIETTNACNMTCGFCPRTNLMTRRIGFLGMETFHSVADQLRPWTDSEWSAWCDFAATHYGVPQDEQSENAFFLYVIAKVIILHGYGDPLLDKQLAKRIRILAERGLPTYFSCNPSNIDVKRSLEMFEAGLSYVKYSVDSVDDHIHKNLRGRMSNYSDAHSRILRIMEVIDKHAYPTQVIITMIDLGRESQAEEFARLQEAYEGTGAYVYLKSEDNQWLDGRSGESNASIHWREPCQFPWTSMSIMADGPVVPCMQDYDSEMVMGDPAKESLRDIWNGEKYAALRRAHFFGASGYKCDKRCDMRLVGGEKLLRVVG